MAATSREAPETTLDFEYDEDFDETWTWYVDTAKSAPKNITGWSATLEIRQQDRTQTALLALTSGSGLSLGGAAGTIRIQITEAQIQAFAVDSGRWHLVMTDGDGDNYVIAKGPWIRHKD